MSGFEDANYFSKVFRRIYGINPTEFRTTGMYAAVRAEALEQRDLPSISRKRLGRPFAITDCSRRASLPSSAL